MPETQSSLIRKSMSVADIHTFRHLPERLGKSLSLEMVYALTRTEVPIEATIDGHFTLEKRPDYANQ